MRSSLFTIEGIPFGFETEDLDFEYSMEACVRGMSILAGLFLTAIMH